MLDRTVRQEDIVSIKERGGWAATHCWSCGWKLRRNEKARCAYCLNREFRKKNPKYVSFHERYSRIINQKALSDYICSVREKYGLSQQQFSVALRMAKTYVNRIECMRDKWIRNDVLVLIMEFDSSAAKESLVKSA